MSIRYRPSHNTTPHLPTRLLMAMANLKQFHRYPPEHQLQNRHMSFPGHSITLFEVSQIAPPKDHSPN